MPLMITEIERPVIDCRLDIVSIHPVCNCLLACLLALRHEILVPSLDNRFEQVLSSVEEIGSVGLTQLVAPRTVVGCPTRRLLVLDNLEAELGRQRLAHECTARSQSW